MPPKFLRPIRELSAAVSLTVLVLGWPVVARAQAFVYWTEQGSETASVWRANPDGSGVTEIYHVTGANGGFNSIESGGDGLYVASQFSGGTATALHPDAALLHIFGAYDVDELAGDIFYGTGATRAGFFAPDGSVAVNFPAAAGDFITGVALDDAYLYYARFNSDRGIWRMAHDGSGLERLTANIQAVYDLEVTSTHLWMAQPFNSQITRVALDGTGFTTVVSSAGFANGIALTDDALWWSDLFGNINRASLDGSGATTVIARGGSANIRGVAVFDPASVAVPEPAAVVALAGVVALGVAGWVRRRR